MQGEGPWEEGSGNTGLAEESVSPFTHPEEGKAASIGSPVNPIDKLKRAVCLGSLQCH